MYQFNSTNGTLCRCLKLLLKTLNMKVMLTRQHVNHIHLLKPIHTNNTILTWPPYLLFSNPPKHFISLGKQTSISHKNIRIRRQTQKPKRPIMSQITIILMEGTRPDRIRVRIERLLRENLRLQEIPFIIRFAAHYY